MLKTFFTIALPLGEYKHAQLPISISCIPNVFQDKTHSLIEELEFIQDYLDDLLFLSNGLFDNHLHKIN